MTQNTPLLSTKYSIFPVRPHILPRPRLYEQLQRIYNYQLTLLVAPAGFGKTTLLNAWSLHAHTGSPSPLIAWFSLNENDNDVLRFWSYVIASLATHLPGLGRDALNLLNTQQPSSIEIALTLLINDLAALPQEVILILDDYHFIEAPSLHITLELLLDRLPQNTHIVITSRTTPPLPLARLRTRGQLYELGLSEIRFTLHEAASFLKSFTQITLSSNVLAILESRIEGWIAGWYLAALALKEAGDVSDFVAQFTGSHRYVIDYLVEEVLRYQPEKVQRFLLQTCILEHLDASLCNAVTGETTGQQMLQFLDQAQLFIVPQDSIRRSYRYHALFAEALRTQLQHIHPQWISDLHLRASRWYASHALLIEAIDHTLLVPDYEHAITLIEKVAQTTSTIWMRNAFSPLHRWLTILPPPFLRRQPQLQILYAWKLFSSLSRDPSIKLEDVEMWLHDAERDLEHVDEDAQTRTMRGEIAAILAFTFLLRGSVSQSTDYGQQALVLLPHENITIRGFATQTLINNHEFFGVATSGISEELLRICQATHDPPARMNALCSIAQLHILRGQLHQAAEIYRLAQEPSELLLKPTVAGTIALASGAILLEWNEIDAAEHALTTGLEQCKENGDPGVLRNGYLGFARLQCIRGDIDGAFATLTEIEHALHKLHMLSQHTLGKLLLADIVTSRTQFYLLQGNIGAANRWAQTRKPVENEELTPLRLRELCILARVYLANQQIEQCLQLLTRLLHVSEQNAHVGNRITLLLVYACTLSIAGDIESALHAIASALTLAEPGGYIRIFVDEGQPIADLLERLHIVHQQKQSSHRVSLPYLRQLRAAFAPQTSTQTAHIQQRPRANAFQLSKREMEVLRLLAIGLTDREIAHHLVLAEGTIKTHAKRIYAKLGVQNRTQAALYAQELHLL